MVELKEAMQKETGAAVQAATPALQEVAEALASLGYKTSEIQDVLGRVRAGSVDSTTEALLKQALQHLQHT